MFHIFSVLVPTGFVLVGQKNNNNINNNNRISIAPYGRNFRGGEARNRQDVTTRKDATLRLN